MFETLEFNRTTEALPPAVPAPRSSLFGFLGDHHLPYIVPALVHWVIGLIFHWIDERGLLSAYKLHTPAEFLKKNRASRRDVVKFALIQQATQCILGYLMADDTEVFHSHDYGIALWAQSIHQIPSRLAHMISYVGFASSWAAKAYANVDVFAHPILHESVRAYLEKSAHVAYSESVAIIPSFSAIEWGTATIIYWVLIPTFQFVFAMFLADTFQYFTHRAFHVNKWLYKYIHSMHHDVYVPFAYGAFYNHPLETIPIDGIGFPLCLKLAGLNNRQAGLFGAIWTFKTVVDHCGYDFPYNPCNIICPNSVLYHDLHHQTWGMKYNFSVYSYVWDWILGTYWAGDDNRAQEKYIRGKEAAERALAKDGPQVDVPVAPSVMSTAREM